MSPIFFSEAQIFIADSLEKPSVPCEHESGSARCIFKACGEAEPDAITRLPRCLGSDFPLFSTLRGHLPYKALGFVFWRTQAKTQAQYDSYSSSDPSGSWS